MGAPNDRVPVHVARARASEAMVTFDLTTNYADIDRLVEHEFVACCRP